MGVSWRECDKCNQSFDGTYGFFICDSCGNCLCDDCVSETGATTVDDVDEDEETYCPFCERDEVTDSDLLGYALTRLGLSYDELVEDFKNSV